MSTASCHCSRPAAAPHGRAGRDAYDDAPQLVLRLDATPLTSSGMRGGGKRGTSCGTSGRGGGGSGVVPVRGQAQCVSEASDPSELGRLKSVRTSLRAGVASRRALHRRMSAVGPAAEGGSLSRDEWDQFVLDCGGRSNLLAALEDVLQGTIDQVRAIHPKAVAA